MNAARCAILAAVLLPAIGGCGERSAASGRAAIVQQTVAAGPVSVRLFLDRDHLTTAERVGLTLEVTTSAGFAATMPDPPTDLGGFTVVEHGTGGARLAPDGAVTNSATWVLEPFLPGDYTLPAIDVAFSSADGMGTVSTKPVIVTVASVLPPDQQETADVGTARDVVEPQRAEGRRSAAWAIGVGLGLAGVVAGAGGWFLVRRRKPASPDVFVAAERRLREIQKSGLTNPGAAVAEASMLLRACIAVRIEPAAATRTTDELLLSPSLSLNLSERDMGVLRAGLRTSDAVKFAGAPVSDGDAKLMMAGAVDLVRSLSALVVVTPELSKARPNQVAVFGGAPT